jgi:hypothetical protein
MPDRYQLVAHALASLPDIDARPALDLPTDSPDDTLAATETMVDAGVEVLVTHGGDGTNRLVALRSNGVPLLPIAAGTNNVFPAPVEPTAAGFAAGVLARNASLDACVQQHKRILVRVGEHEDQALVDAAVVRDESIGGRAVWDPARVVACLVTRAAPGAVGLSGLAGALVSVGARDPFGAFVEMGSGTRVLTLIAPGRAERTEVRDVRRVEPGESIQIGPLSGAVTLDGERHLLLRDEKVQLTLHTDGPLVVDVPATLAWAQRIGAFSI